MNTLDSFIFCVGQFDSLTIPYGIIISVLTLVILFLFSAFISASEVSFFGFTTREVDELNNSDSKRDELVQQLKSSPDTLLATFLIAENIVNIAIVILSTYLVFSLFDFSKQIWFGLFVTMASVTFLLLLFGQYIPKMYASKNPLKVARKTAPLTNCLRKLFYPFTWLFVKPTNKAKLFEKTLRLIDRKAKEEERKREEAEKIRLAKIAAEKEKARIEAENKARLEALALEKKRADEEAKRLKDIADKKAAEEAERAKIAAAADAKKLEDARKTADAEKAEARRLAAAKEAADAAAKAKEAADKAAAARAAEATLAKKNEDDKKAAETKAMTNFGVSTAVGNNFAANRGRMGMPAYGTITHRFGRQPHPVFKNIVEENNGIKIAVTKGTIAKCIAPGTVSRIVASGDGSKMVFVKHGDYFTIYANLSTTMVSANQQVSAGTSIGAVGEDFDGTYTLDFQIWNGTNPVDPLSWVN